MSYSNETKYIINVEIGRFGS